MARISPPSGPLPCAPAPLPRDGAPNFNVTCHCPARQQSSSLQRRLCLLDCPLSRAMTPGEVVVNVTYLGALIAGFLRFLSTCVLPLVPPYLCFLGGTTFDQLTGEDETPSHVYTTVVLSSVAFVLGFTTVFVILGATATAAGQLIAENLPLLSKIAGVAIIIAGLHFLGLIPFPVLHREARYPAAARPAGLFGAYLIGVAFAFGWTPCIGPVLAAILAIAAGEDSVRQGVGLLFVYSLGLGIPFIVAAIAIRPFLSTMQRFRKHLATVEKLLGGFLVLTGVLFLTNSMTLIASWMLELFPGLATIG